MEGNKEKREGRLKKAFLISYCFTSPSRGRNRSVREKIDKKLRKQKEAREIEGIDEDQKPL